MSEPISAMEVLARQKTALQHLKELGDNPQSNPPSSQDDHKLQPSDRYGMVGRSTIPYSRDSKRWKDFCNEVKRLSHDAKSKKIHSSDPRPLTHPKETPSPSQPSQPSQPPRLPQLPQYPPVDLLLTQDPLSPSPPSGPPPCPSPPSGPPLSPSPIPSFFQVQQSPALSEPCDSPKTLYAYMLKCSCGIEFDHLDVYVPCLSDALGKHIKFSGEFNCPNCGKAYIQSTQGSDGVWKI